MGSASIARGDTAQQLAALLGQLRASGVDGYVLPPDDNHLNEYVLPDQRRVEWLTGFSGENALVLVAPAATTLFVDGRFHIQVDQEVDGSVITISKLGLPKAPTFVEALHQALTGNRKSKTSFKLGYDPNTMAIQRLNTLQQQVQAESWGEAIKWVPVEHNLIDAIWTDKSSPDLAPAQSVGLDQAGQSVADKLTVIRQAMKKNHANLLPLVRLDEVAWLFNMRGQDIPFNPVTQAYGLVSTQKAQLFVAKGKISIAMQRSLRRQGVELLEYDRFWPTFKQALARLKTTAKSKSTAAKRPASGRSHVWLDELGTPVKLKQWAQPAVPVLTKTSPVFWQKALKNPTEQDGMRWANLKSSVVLIRHMAWVEAEIQAQRFPTERQLKDHLEQTYRSDPDFYDLSFGSIIGLGANSAIIHYSQTDQTHPAKPGQLYLLDSGAHFYGDKAGTTDTTRTMSIGAPTPDQIEKYTLVLQAHIACAMATFPKGTTGVQVDAMTRQPMWHQRLDFRHGTGHGVGAFLNVHEGPCGIHARGSVALEPGMVLSIEPGYYEADWGGIRIENLGLVKSFNPDRPDGETEWLGFEPLTWVPYHRALIDASQLTPAAMEWLKTYYTALCMHMDALNTLTQAEWQWLRHQVDWVLASP